MSIDVVPQLDEESLRVFAEKGTQGGRDLPQVGIGNAVKVRRVTQLVHDIVNQPLDGLRILDVACGEGVYSIELGLRGAKVVGMDARNERMDLGVGCTQRNGLSNVEFKKDDVRNLTRENYGDFDVILFLGILYHLDVPNSIHVLEQLLGMCRRALIVDTHVSLNGPEKFDYKGRTYFGAKHREHGDLDSAETRQGRLLMSVDNTYSFWFTKESLVALLKDVGFTSVLECYVPVEPNKPANRVTLAAISGAPIQVAAYPWINSLSDEQIASKLQFHQKMSVKKRLQKAVNAVLRRFNLEIRPVR